jgi:hypothetical protein
VTKPKPTKPSETKAKATKGKQPTRYLSEALTVFLADLIIKQRAKGKR